MAGPRRRPLSDNSRLCRLLGVLLVCGVVGNLLAQTGTNDVMITITCDPASPFAADFGEWYETTVTATAIPPSPAGLTGPTWALDWIKAVDFLYAPPSDGLWAPADSTTGSWMIVEVPGPGSPYGDTTSALLSFSVLEPGDLRFTLQKQVTYAGGGQTWTGKAESPFVAQAPTQQILNIIKPNTKRGPGTGGTKIVLEGGNYSMGNDLLAIFKNGVTLRQGDDFKLIQFGKEVQRITSGGKDTKFEFTVELLEGVNLKAGDYFITVSKGQKEKRRDKYTVLK